jgi:hypothetical protein
MFLLVCLMGFFTGCFITLWLSVQTRKAHDDKIKDYLSKTIKAYPRTGKPQNFLIYRLDQLNKLMQQEAI